MFRLLRYFSIASFVALALATAVIVLLTRGMAVRQLIERAETSNVVLTQAFGNSMGPRFALYLREVSGLDAEALRARPETEEIRHTFEVMTHDLAVLQVRIHSLAGITVFSTQEREIGGDASQNPGFLTAVRDVVPVSSLVRRRPEGGSSAGGDERVIVETFVPLHVLLGHHGDEEVEAVFQIDSDVTGWVAEIDQAETGLFLRLLVIFGVLYGVLFLIIRRADSILKRQYDDLLSVQQDLICQKDQAQQAERAKSEFLANMSHEIRTPMTAILGFMDLLASEDRSEQAVRKRLQAIEIIRRNGEHLIELINAILDLSKLEAGGLELEPVAFSPTALVEDVVDLMRVRARAKGLPLELEVDSTTPTALEGDATRIRQILINLVANAINFTETGTVRVVVGFESDADCPALWLEVADTGIGIPGAQIDQMFDAFTQADGSSTRRYGGTGLGLTICKRLTSLLGGEIQATSDPGVGSTFRVSLPLVVVPPETLPRKIRELSARESRARRSPSAGGKRRLRCRVLVADDNPDNQQLLAGALVDAGAEVEIASDGEMALDRVLTSRERGNPIDAVVMDMQMPSLDGYEAARRLRAMEYRGGIVAVTANALPGDRRKCLDAGCDDYLTKPIDRRQLVEMVARYVETRSRGSSR